MRIAVFDPRLRVAGVTEFAYHARDGFRAAGHECDLLTFEKSGRRRKTQGATDGQQRNGWYWSRLAPDVVGKWKDAPEILRGYDFVLLNEPKNGTLDRDSMKKLGDGKTKIGRERALAGEGPEPEYLRVLGEAQVPWSTVLHAPQYQQALAPYLARAWTTAGFTGKVLELRDGSLATGIWSVGDATVAPVTYKFLPYTPARGEGISGPPKRTVGMLGRYTTVKGMPTLASVSDEALPPGWTTELWGSESGGLGPGTSWLTYEGLSRQLGWQGTREGRPTPAGPDDIGNQGDVQHNWQFTLEKNGRTVRYRGGYTDPVGVCEGLDVFLNLTTEAFAGHGTEYTTLEALDAGCVPVLPEYAISEGSSYRALVLKHYKSGIVLTAVKGAPLKFEAFDPAAREELVAGVHRTCEMVETSPHWVAEVVAHNRAEFRRLHDPAKFAEFCLETLR